MSYGVRGTEAGGDDILLGSQRFGEIVLRVLGVRLSTRQKCRSFPSSLSECRKEHTNAPDSVPFSKQRTYAQMKTEEMF